jgi:hypothetical protein
MKRRKLEIIGYVVFIGDLPTPIWLYWTSLFCRNHMETEPHPDLVQGIEKDGAKFLKEDDGGMTLDQILSPLGNFQLVLPCSSSVNFPRYTFFLFFSL